MLLPFVPVVLSLLSQTELSLAPITSSEREHPNIIKYVYLILFDYLSINIFSTCNLHAYIPSTQLDNGSIHSPSVFSATPRSTGLDRIGHTSKRFGRPAMQG